MSARWSIISPATYAAVLPLARGTYQRDILAGWEALSGSTLKGKAKRFSGRYRQSSANLLRRVREAGYQVTEVRGPRGARILVIQ